MNPTQASRRATIRSQRRMTLIFALAILIPSGYGSVSNEL